MKVFSAKGNDEMVSAGESERVLLIDDDPHIHDLVSFHLENRVGGVISAMDARSGKSLAVQQRPSLILLDIQMPDEDGVSLCRSLQRLPETRDIPVVFLTGCEEEAQLAEAFDAGAVDYIKKPICQTELVARVGARLRAKSTLDRVREQARVDGLTGLGNRAALDEMLAEKSREWEKEGFCFSLAILDLDHFKRINDDRGHQAGDLVLAAAAAAFGKVSRPSDRLYRYGGDEFVAMIPGEDARDTLRVVERMVAAASEIRFDAPHEDIQISCSAGVVSPDASLSIFESAQVLELADRALYHAKRMGRNCAVAYSDSM
jgi:diguanylate cyclase (GGDEF)-like protein